MATRSMYYLLVTYEGYNVKYKAEDNDDDLWDFGERNEDLFGIIQKLYENKPEEGLVLIKEEGEV